MDLYVVLGVRQDASESEIKRAYRRLARRFHPDINPGDREAAAHFQQVLEAYETLIDRERRVRYDSGEAAPPAEARRSGFEGFDFSSRGPDYSATFGDLMAEVLIEHGARRPAAARGTDLHHDVRISFAESFTGCEQALTVTRRETCRSCRGAGVARTAAGPCGLCQGQGVVRTVRGHMVFSRSCNACGGTGQQPPTAVPVVHRGRPRGAHRARDRPAAAGHCRRRARPAGRQGRCRARAAVRPATCTSRCTWCPTPSSGARATTCTSCCPWPCTRAASAPGSKLPVFDGTVKVRIPPGTQSGQQFRIRERGMASTRGGPRGDLVVEARLMLPAVLDERSRALLREFGEINDGAEIRRDACRPAPEAETSQE